MAAAFGVPVVVIFGSSDPAIWGPWRTTAEVADAARPDIAAIPVQRVIAGARPLRVHA